MKEIFKYILKALSIFLLFVTCFILSGVSYYVDTKMHMIPYPILIIFLLCHAGADFLIRSLAKEGQSGFCKGVKVFFTFYFCLSLFLCIVVLLLWILGVQIP